MQWERCDPSTYQGRCKNNFQITEWLKRKFIVVLNNEEKFKDQGFEDAILKVEEEFKDQQFEDVKIARVSRFHWIPIASDRRIERAYEITMSELALEDSLIFRFSRMYWNEQIFGVKYLENRPYEHNDQVQISIVY